MKMISFEHLLHVSEHTLMISSFVFAMMLLVEYINVITSGKWQSSLLKRRYFQYLLAAFLGVTPGCLGAFVAYTLFAHRNISLGALVAAMIATSGDEAFVMFAMIPKEAIGLSLILFCLAIVVGFLTDKIFSKDMNFSRDHGLEVHPEHACECFPTKKIFDYWKNLSIGRGVIFFGLLLFVITLIIGEVGPAIWNWKKIIFVFISFLGMFIVATVPEHFLEEHLWGHVTKRHLPKIVLWTFIALLAVEFITHNLQIEELIKNNVMQVLVSAGLVGLIPSSGPHLIYVTLFSKGVIPFSTLLVSSIVQDGHGMIPVLSHSYKLFFLVKLINLAVGLIVGGVVLLFIF